MKVTDALMAAVEPYMDRRVSIYLPFQNGADTYGELIPGDVAVAGLSDLKCCIGDKVRRETNGISVSARVDTHETVVLLAGYYPTIIPRMRAQDDAGIMYDIDHVAHDQTRTVTELIVRLVA